MITTIEKKQRIDEFFRDWQEKHWSCQNTYDFLFDETIVIPGKGGINTWILRDGYHLLNDHPKEWDVFDKRFLAMSIYDKRYSDHFDYQFLDDWLFPKLNAHAPVTFLDEVSTGLQQAAGISKTEWLAGIVHRYRYDQKNLLPVGQTKLATYIVSQEESQLEKVAELLLFDSHLLLNLLIHTNKVILAEKLFPAFLKLIKETDGWAINPACTDAYLALNPSRFEPLIVAQLPALSHPVHYRLVQQHLATHLPQQYEGKAVDMAYAYLECVRRQAQEFNGAIKLYGPYNAAERRYVSDLEQPVALLLDQGGQTGYQFIENWLKELRRMPPGLLTVFADRASLLGSSLFMEGLRIYPQYNAHTKDFYKAFFKLLSSLNYADYYPQIWAYTRDSSKQMRELAAVTLAKLGESAIPEAEKLLTDKKAEFRQTGALILSLIKTDGALQLLMNALDAEKNDDARDLMLAGLAGLLPVPNSESDVMTLVDKARQRGKLDMPVASYLPDSKLPILYWHSSGEAVPAAVVRFLLYRQNRAKDIRPDPEARPLYALIDRQRSEPFASAVLKAYMNEGGADPKLKGCLTIGAMLGGDNEIEILKAKVTQWAEASRGKMAEYAVQALALVGTNKALRAVEFFSRKYKNKNKNIGAAANEAFAIAADTLGISPYDLADSIIPDFGFEGLFRTFDVGGDTYRAFVDTDFKLAFLNEDNKLVKSVPKAAPTVLKEEFKEIGKEIRDIVKAQSGRLEQYLVIQRKWPADKWNAFFLGNPIMFAYAVRLIWGIFDANQKLLSTFQCLEDQTLVDNYGDEMQLSTKTFIGMVHPLSLPTDQLDYWAEQLTDSGIDPIFPQLNRRVVSMPPSALSLTIDRQYAGVEYGGYGFIGKMEKLGWFRGSVQDSGWIASYYKDFSEVGLTAIIMQQGNICVGYYDENAALGNLMFVATKSVTFGNYTYDEPENDADPRLIRIGDVPPIVYSEVMADLLFFTENDARKDAPSHD